MEDARFVGLYNDRLHIYRMWEIPDTVNSTGGYKLVFELDR